MLLFKNKIIQRAIEKLPAESSKSRQVRIKRIQAKEFLDSGVCDQQGKITIFGQLYTQCTQDETLVKCFNLNGVDDQIFGCLFSGEHADDHGGPFRDMLTSMAAEILSPALPLMVRTANNRNEIGSDRNCWTINCGSTTPTHEELFRFLGYFLGFSMRTKSPLDLDFPPLFWKKILDEPTSIEDLKAVDKYTYQLLKDTEEHAKVLSEEEFDVAVEETFTTTLSDLKVAELCPGGNDKRVTHKNVQEFIDLVVKARLNEADKQYGWIKEGIEKVVPISIFAFLTARQLEWRVTGNPEITVEAMKAVTDGAESDNKIMKWFWKMFEGWT
jgi:E3 ubiquitin-protein ligase HERC2